MSETPEFTRRQAKPHGLCCFRCLSLHLAGFGHYDIFDQVHRLLRVTSHLVIRVDPRHPQFLAETATFIAFSADNSFGVIMPSVALMCHYIATDTHQYSQQSCVALGSNDLTTLLRPLSAPPRHSHLLASNRVPLRATCPRPDHLCTHVANKAHDAD